MGRVDDFLNSRHDTADAVMGQSTFQVSATTFSVVFNQYSLETIGADGGIEHQKAALAVAQPADVSSPDLLTGMRCSVDSVTYRIDRVEEGAVAVTFHLVDADQTS